MQSISDINKVKALMKNAAVKAFRFLVVSFYKTFIERVNAYSTENPIPIIKKN